MSSTHGVQQNFLKLSVVYTKKNSDPVYEKQNKKKITTTQTFLSSSGKGDPLHPEKCALIFFSFLFFFFKSVNCVCTVLCVNFQTLKTNHYHIIPLCKQCSSWGQIVLLSLPLTLHLCHTWGFQKQLVHYYFHVQSILCTVF